MKRKPVILEFGELMRNRATSKVAYVILCSCGESYPIRMVLDRTGTGKLTEQLNASVLNLDKFDTPFTYAIIKEVDMPNNTPLKDLSLFLHGQRMRIADKIGATAFSGIDKYVCRTIRKAIA